MSSKQEFQLTKFSFLKFIVSLCSSLSYQSGFKFYGKRLQLILESLLALNLNFNKKLKNRTKRKMENLVLFTNSAPIDWFQNFEKGFNIIKKSKISKSGGIFEELKIKNWKNIYVKKNAHFLSQWRKKRADLMPNFFCTRTEKIFIIRVIILSKQRLHAILNFY